MSYGIWYSISNILWYAISYMLYKYELSGQMTLTCDLRSWTSSKVTLTQSQVYEIITPPLVLQAGELVRILLPSTVNALITFTTWNRVDVRSHVSVWNYQQHQCLDQCLSCWYRWMMPRAQLQTAALQRGCIVCEPRNGFNPSEIQNIAIIKKDRVFRWEKIGKAS